MPRPSRADRQNEVAFCAEVSKWSDFIFKSDSSLWFHHSLIEQYATGSNKRADLRFFDKNNSLILCGEVKLPGADQGESPYNPILMADAYNKATMDNCRYFFTWNVEELALFDRSVWDAPTMNDRYVHSWKLNMRLDHPSDVTSPTVIRKLRDDFLPEVFRDIEAILAGRQQEFSRPPADIFLTVLESYLLGPNAPVRELQYYLEDMSAKDAAFKKRFIDWMVKEQEWNIDPDDFKTWQKDVERAAESMCYILNNRILFYQAIALRNRLPELTFPDTVKTPESALKRLNDCFEIAVHKTGDYESIFRPERESDDWTTVAALSGDNSIQAWNNVIHWVEKLDFKELPSDILGKTFQKLISPEERHRFGQHYTDETIVDVINAFCIRKGTETIFDPSCGSGGFLVRAYYRKQQLDKSQSHQRLLSDIYGCDINAYPAHLATLNLAARKIENEENYPRIAHKNFFKVKAETTFCELPIMDAPGEGHRGTKRIKLPEIDAVVGNPPYVRQEKIPKKADRRVVADQTKEYIGKVAESSYPGSQLTKQSDLHVYFWLASARFLSKKGMFGFLTSSSWLDAKYGFALQRWILTHFKLIAIIESLDEPWFSDARIKTCATIMERCDVAAERSTNIVRFVRLKRPLAEILGKSKWEAVEEFDGQEHLRQEAAEKLRDLILMKSVDYSGEELRILTKRQSELWDDGLSVAEMFERQKQLSKQSLDDDDDSTDENEDVNSVPPRKYNATNNLRDYGGGKWGRYLRAPEFYFDLMKEFGSRFTRMGDIALIKRGITSGCDAFFMPRDVSAKMLAKHRTELEWQIAPLFRKCKRREVEEGNLKIIQAGDKTLHPIESEFVMPEVHSLMTVNRPRIGAKETDRVVLWTDKELDDLKGTFAHNYILWGSRQTFDSTVRVPKRSTCESRQRWYDVTGLTPGIGFWPMAQKYRHIIPYNQDRIPCNHNLFDIHSLGLSPKDEKALMAILNSTLLAFFKHFYGRYAGAEGTLKTEVVDSLMMEIPSPVGVSPELSEKLGLALDRISQRDVTHLLEEEFRICTNVAEMRILEKNPIGLPHELQKPDRRDLDLLVFEVLGVHSAERREKLVDQLYYETTKYYRALRIQDIQSSANRSQGGSRGASANSIAMGAWQQIDDDLKVPLADWLSNEITNGNIIELPEGEVRLPDISNMFENATLYIGRPNPINIQCDSRIEAELLEKIASEGLRGKVPSPKTEKEAQAVFDNLISRLDTADAAFTKLAEQYASDDKLQGQVKSLLHKWFIHGKFD